MVASIKAVGLLQPLIVRPIADEEYQVIAGNRRLAALRQVHRSDVPKVACVVRDVDDHAAETLALAENFIREGMSPLDEAESFARLAADKAKGPDGIASMFGVTERYVRQRMKLAGLAKVVKSALRQDEIDIGTAEAFASIPEDRQTAVWEEMNGHPRHAEHVRNVIHHAWIDAKHALFDLSTLPEWKVSQDLFAERVLVERDVFIAAQTEALEKEKSLLLEDGWREVVVGKYEEINGLTRTLTIPDREFDAAIEKKLSQLAERRQAWEAKLEALADDDEKGITAVESKIEALDAQAQDIEQHAPLVHSETTKSVGTMFLMLLPDGQVRRDYRVPRVVMRPSGGSNGTESNGSVPQPCPPTSEDLNERQLADLFTHQALAVRQALLKAPAVRKRVLALILHEKVRGEALAVRHEANAVTLHASQDGFKSEPFQQLKEKRAAIDPFTDEYSIDEAAAFDKLGEMSTDRLNQLIDLLVVDCLTAHLQRNTGLVQRLSAELKVDLRKTWRPDAVWLSGYQKVQLSHLLADRKGPVYSPTNETRKKSELVEAATALFADGAEGKLGDPTLAGRVNAWLPSVLCPMNATADYREKEEK
jgi:ParB family chromosome partitioning protein